MSTQGERIREERERLEMSQTAFGAVGGVRKQAQMNYEKGERSPDSLYLAAISKIGADIQYIVTGQRTQGALGEELAEVVRLYQSAPIQVKAAVLGALTAGTETQTSVGSADKMENTSLSVSGNNNTVAGQRVVKK